tara:strand:- start:1907 stop:2476 length:570 start_codon:yes stop_codon:yes gene_type:complete
MEKTGKHQNDYWTSYYKNKKTINVPSYFCDFVIKNYNLKDKKVVEFCCGNGRDTYTLSNHCSSIVGVDFATKPKDNGNCSFIQADIDSFLNSNSSDNFDTSYCRFGIHSISEELEDKILDFSKEIYFEFRSDLDNSFKPDHYRRTINGNYFINKVIKKGYKILFFQESIDLAPFGDQNPIIIRIIAKKT